MGEKQYYDGDAIYPVLTVSFKTSTRNIPNLAKMGASQKGDMGDLRV